MIRGIVELESQRAEKIPVSIPIPNLSMCSNDQGEKHSCTACTYVEHLHSTGSRKKTKGFCWGREQYTLLWNLSIVGVVGLDWLLVDRIIGGC